MKKLEKTVDAQSAEIDNLIQEINLWTDISRVKQ